jgi:hypothetical protein
VDVRAIHNITKKVHDLNEYVVHRFSLPLQILHFKQGPPDGQRAIDGYVSTLQAFWQSPMAPRHNGPNCHDSLRPPIELMGKIFRWRSKPTPKQDFDAVERCSPSIVFGKVDLWRFCGRPGQLKTTHSISLILLCF